MNEKQFSYKYSQSRASQASRVTTDTMIRSSHNSSRKNEIEMKEFDQPVLDIERSSQNIRRKRQQNNQTQDSHGLRDIHEENIREQSVIDDLDEKLPNDKQNHISNCETPDSSRNVEKSKKDQQIINPVQLIQDKMHKKQILSIMGFIILSTLLFSIVCITLSRSIYESNSLLNFKNNESLVNLQPVEITYLPFYSAKVTFSTCIFVVSLVYILIQNFIAYRKYGIFHQNEFYTVPYDTLKTLHLFYCLLAGILLNIALFSLFYSFEMASELKLSTSINTSLFTLITIFMLGCSFIFFGQKVKLIQLLGSIVIIMGLAVLYMTISATTEENQSLSKLVVIKFVSINILTVICFGLILILWREIKIKGKIQYSTAASAIMFFEGIQSLVVYIILIVLDLYQITVSIQSPINQYSANLYIIYLSGFSFAFAVLCLSAALNLQSYSRALSLITFVPLVHLAYDIFYDRQLLKQISLLVSIGLLISGSLLISSSQSSNNIKSKKDQIEFKSPIKEPLLNKERLQNPDRTKRQLQLIK